MAKVKRGPDGKFVSKKDTDNAVAIFTSVGDGTCGFKNLTMTVQPGEYGTNNGKRIRFIDGIYKTSDPEEIEFLKWKEKHPQPFSKIKCIQEAKSEKEDK
ncbi:MAG: hypothetical protein ACLFPF_07135 [Halanaerobiales bacterium]